MQQQNDPGYNRYKQKSSQLPLTNQLSQNNSGFLSQHKFDKQNVYQHPHQQSALNNQNFVVQNQNQTQPYYGPQNVVGQQQQCYNNGHLYGSSSVQHNQQQNHNGLSGNKFKIYL